MDKQDLTPTIEELQARIMEGVCISCAKPFTDDNVFTELGWRETRISNTCEKCFDALFVGDED